MSIDEIIRAVQRKLGVEADGRAGPQTWDAIYGRILGTVSRPAMPPAGNDLVDARSERVIAGLQPRVRPYARALVRKAAAAGISIKVISGFRTYGEQNALYAKGRTAPGSIVTSARGGYSNHNFGIAFDIGVFDGSRYVSESPRYKAVGAIGIDLGLDWGGNWRTFRDEPHFQLRPGWATGREREMLAELRARNASGRNIWPSIARTASRSSTVTATLL